MNRRAHRSKKELGQASVEFAIIIPFVLMLMATVVDLGTYAVRAASLETAAADVAHQIEASPSMTSADATAYVKNTYPLFGSDVSVSLGKPSDSSVGYTYYIDGGTGFKEISTQADSKKEDVTLTFTGTWVMPWSSAVSGNPGYTLTKTVTATTDQTWEDFA